MTRYKKYNAVRWARRISQVFFLLLFFLLLLQTNIDSLTDPKALPTIAAPVGLFLESDPLVAIVTVITTQELYRNLIWAIVIIIGTFFIGRFFCGWICPMGTISHFLSSIKYGKTRGKHRLDANRYKPYQRWKYGILFVFLGSAFFTSLQIGLLDPIALLTRSMTLTVLPAYNVLTQSFISWSGSGTFGFANSIVDFLGAIVSELVIRSKPVYYQGALLIILIFAAILFANRLITRFWCRALCPLGALLGILSRYSIFGMEKEKSLCTDCNVCALTCQGADDPQPGLKWRQSECHLCFNCVADCPEAGIDFKFFPRTNETIQPVDIKRRTVFTTTAAGLAAVPLMRAEAGLTKGNDPNLVRPPGAVEEKDFLARCIRCGECMNVCPNNALHPTFLQAGFEGIWSPILVPRIGYCEPTCVLCSQVCPTGAIDEISEEEKAWVPVKGQEKTMNPPIRIGTAFYDFGRCLPWAMATPCIVCEEWCPTSPKSIYFEEAEVQNQKGEYVPVKRPHVDPKLCIGCGACSYACPVKGSPAIYVISVGETRNPGNSILLKSS